MAASNILSPKPWRVGKELGCLLAIALLSVNGTGLEAQELHPKAGHSHDALSADGLSSIEWDNVHTRITSYVQRALGFMDAREVRVRSLSEVEGTSLRLALIDLTLSGVKRTLRYWVTPDGREIIDGRVSALDGDPWISTRSLLDLNRAPSKGSSAAPVTIVEFTDLQCPYCAQSHATIRRLQQSAPDRIRVVFKHFPLTDIHPWAMEAAVAASCISIQDDRQFWSFVDAVFDHQGEWQKLAADTVAERLRDLGRSIGADGSALASCMTNRDARDGVEASMRNGQVLGVNSTPTLFVNGRTIAGLLSEDQLQRLVDDETARVLSQ